MTLTCWQDHILIENIWFVWSKTSYSGDERRCHGCGTTEQRTISEDRATQPMLGFAFSHHQQGRINFNTVKPSLSTGKDFLIHSL